jgi:hypothetical protein
MDTGDDLGRVRRVASVARRKRQATRRGERRRSRIAGHIKRKRRRATRRSRPAPIERDRASANFRVTAGKAFASEPGTPHSDDERLLPGWMLTSMRCRRACRSMRIE